MLETSGKLKTLKNSQSEYQDNVKRKQLEIFREELKSVDRTYKNRKHDPFVELSGRMGNTKNTFTFKNRLQGYGVNLRLHEFKIKDLNMAIRSLIKHITTNLEFNETIDLIEYGKILNDEQLSVPNINDRDFREDALYMTYSMEITLEKIDLQRILMILILQKVYKPIKTLYLNTTIASLGKQRQH